MVMAELSALSATPSARELVRLLDVLSAAGALGRTTQVIAEQMLLCAIRLERVGLDALMRDTPWRGADVPGFRWITVGALTNPTRGGDELLTWSVRERSVITRFSAVHLSTTST
jgi:hypothetical protein